MRGPPPGEPQEPWRVPAIKAHPAGASVRGATPHLRVYFVMATCADPASAATLDTLARRGSISEARRGGSCIRLKGVNGPRLDGGPSKLTPLPPPSLAGPAAHGRQPNRLAQISLKRGRMATRLSAVFVLVCALAVASRACQIHDRSGRSLLADDKIQFNYAKSGEDWPDVMCNFGKEQSPINVDLAATPAFEDEKLHVRIGTFGKGKNVSSFSTGQGLQVVWDWVEEADLQIPVLGPEHTSVLDDYSANSTVKYVKAEPIQFHFHTPSENTIDGRFFPLEAHIVCLISKEELPSCGDAGCIAVFGIHYEFALERNMFFDMIFAAAPRETGADFAGAIDPEYVLNLDLLVPSKRDYVMWKGSLTTPPCKEGVLWILFVEFGNIAVEELFSLQNHMRDVKTACMEQALQESNINGLKEKVSACDFIGDRTNNRPIQPINRRIIKKGYMDSI